MPTESLSSPASQKLRDRIRSKWSELTDEEIAYKTINPQKFYEAVEAKHGLKKDQVETQVRDWEKEFRSAA